MTAPKPEAPTLDELIEHQRQLLENYQSNPVVELIARNILASLERLRAIEQAANLEGVAPEMLISVLRGEVRLATQAAVQAAGMPEPLP